MHKLDFHDIQESENQAIEAESIYFHCMEELRNNSTVTEKEELVDQILGDAVEDLVDWVNDFDIEGPAEDDLDTQKSILSKLLAARGGLAQIYNDSNGEIVKAAETYWKVDDAINSII